jgi:hypothetical protein
VKIICAWCQTVIEDRHNRELVSHGICETCEQKFDPTEAPAKPPPAQDPASEALALTPHD